MKLKWQQAPVKTQWGDDMVVASVAIDKDHTVCLYCERDQTPKVDAMFAQRPWVNATTWRGLSDEEALECWPGLAMYADCAKFWENIESKLKKKNT